MNRKTPSKTSIYAIIATFNVTEQLIIQKKYVDKLSDEEIANKLKLSIEKVTATCSEFSKRMYLEARPGKREELGKRELVGTSRKSFKIIAAINDNLSRFSEQEIAYLMLALRDEQIHALKYILRNKEGVNPTIEIIAESMNKTSAAAEDIVGRILFVINSYQFGISERIKLIETPHETLKHIFADSNHELKSVVSLSRVKEKKLYLRDKAIMERLEIDEHTYDSHIRQIKIGLRDYNPSSEEHSYNLKVKS